MASIIKTLLLATKQVQKIFNIKTEAHLVSEKCGWTLCVTSVWYANVFFLELIFFYSQAFDAEMEQWHSNNKTTANEWLNEMKRKSERDGRVKM